MATTQPTPQPSNPTTETPLTTNQQTQEPVDPLTIDSTNGNTNGDIQTTDSEEAAGTELRVPTTSETPTDLPIQSSQSADIGLIIGIVVIVIVTVVVVSVVTVVVIIAVLFKRRGSVVVKKTEALANPVYDNNGQ